jgi:hypothetical protein
MADRQFVAAVFDQAYGNYYPHEPGLPKNQVVRSTLDCGGLSVS